MRAVENLPIPAAAMQPLRVLTKAVADKLALANEVKRFLSRHDCKVLDVALGGKRPLLTVERVGGPLLSQVCTGVIQLRPAPGVRYCRAYMLGCEIEWLCPSEEVH